MLGSVNEIYEFRRIPISDKPSDNLELLNYLGIARPKMVQKLAKIRNAVEHQDAEPPDQKACLDFLEFTWYFLRSTDSLVRRPIQSIILDPSKSELDPQHYGVEIEFDLEKDWTPKIRAWLEPMLLSSESVNDWIILNVKDTTTREVVLAREGKPADSTEWDIGRGRNPEDIYVVAEVRGPAHHLRKIYRTYFWTV